jgi:demethylmenaquinone methyltransferase/2-methoxy-6-polyprenyl-1,4-benzoquinol methylase
MNPLKILEGAGIEPGQTILEVGCGTGFFTMPAARMIGDQGHLVAMDVLSKYTERVWKKVQESPSPHCP